jgi:hypothetical protein
MADKKVMLKIAPTTGDPIKGADIKETTYLSPGAATSERNFDLRDRLMELVGKGNVLNQTEKAALYQDLSKMVGAGSAQKLMDHAYIFNTRPDVQKLPVEAKLNAFYTIGSHDPYVNDIIGKTKSLGYGVGHGLRTSSSTINQQLTGRSPISALVEPTEAQRKIMLKVKK